MNKKSMFFIFASASLILLGLFLAVSLGAKNIPFQTVIDSIFHYEDTLDMQLVRDLRLPRALTSLLVGGLLAMAGAMMQGVTRNPIAEPSLMGVTQGATLAIAILYGIGGATSEAAMLISAFVGAFASGILVLVFSLRNAHSMNISRLLLAGTALSTFFLSMSSAIAILTNRSQNLAYWVSGGLRNISFHTFRLVAIVAIVCVIIAIFLAPKINIVNLGEDVAIGLGVNPVKIRILTLLCLIPMCAACVAAAGNISFVGLIVPQLIIKIVGVDYRKIIPASFIGGALLLLYSDIAARLINMPYETPIGIFTTMIGVPFFLWFVRKERG